MSSLTLVFVTVMLVYSLWRIEKLLTHILAELRWSRLADQYHPEENRTP